MTADGLVSLIRLITERPSIEQSDLDEHRVFVPKNQTMSVLSLLRLQIG